MVSGESSWVMARPSESVKVISTTVPPSCWPDEMPDSLLLPEVTLRVVLAWLLKLGGTKRLPTTSPSGDLGSSTIPLEVRLPRLMTTGLASRVRDGTLLGVSVCRVLLLTELELDEADATSRKEGRTLSDSETEAVSSGDFRAGEDKVSSEDSLEFGV